MRNLSSQNAAIEERHTRKLNKYLQNDSINATNIVSDLKIIKYPLLV